MEIKTKKKHHNWTTNGTVVDRKTDEIALRFIDACTHLTPERMAELDNLIKVSPEVRDHNAGIKLIKTGRQVNPEIVEENWGGNWDDVEPTGKELRDIERGE